MLRIGVDIGGTFTDFAVWDGNPVGYAAVEAFKVPSTPPDFARGVKDGLEQLIRRGRIAVETPLLIVHGTTVSTNAVIERSGPPIALLTTTGFKDILNLARLRLDKPVDLFNRRPAPLIPRHLVYEIDERILADGRVDRPIDVEQAVEAACAAQEAGAVAVAICFIHSYRNGEHERRAGAAIRAKLPGLDVVLSHEVWPQQSEYERASAALLNVYARTTMAGYIADLQSFLDQRLPKARLFITKSNGGVMATGEAIRMPIHTLLSGPAAGVTASRVLGEMLQEPNLLTMDMGGTSTDISMIRDGAAMVSHDGKVGDFPLMMPVNAIEAIGAGGGSIAWMDGPVLKVGPRSAGAVPGPACYGRGGTQPTVSDAYLLCGYLSEDVPLAGRLELRRELAEAAMAPLAERLGGDTTMAAESCLAVATANMLANALPFIARLGLVARRAHLDDFRRRRRHSRAAARRRDRHRPGRRAACLVGVLRLRLPCLGSSLRPRAHGARRRRRCASDHRQLCRARAAGRALARRPGRSRFQRRAGASSTSPTSATRASPSTSTRGSTRRWREPAISPPWRTLSMPSTIASTAMPSRGRRSRSWRCGCACAARLARPARPAIDRAAAQRVEPRRRRRVRFDGAWHDAAIYDGSDLPTGWRGAGPAIVEQETSTIVVPPSFTVEIGRVRRPGPERKA